MSRTTAINVPTTPVTAAARGPTKTLAAATKAVTIAAAISRAAIGEAMCVGDIRLTMMPTATIATIAARVANQSLRSTGPLRNVTGPGPLEWFVREIAAT